MIDKTFDVWRLYICNNYNIILKKEKKTLYFIIITILVNCGACKRNQNGKLELATILIIKMIQILWKKYIFDDYK